VLWITFCIEIIAIVRTLLYGAKGLKYIQVRQDNKQIYDIITRGVQVIDVQCVVVGVAAVLIPVYLGAGLNTSLLD
jgi:uncharacterized metal-binding protein